MQRVYFLCRSMYTEKYRHTHIHARTHVRAHTTRTRACLRPGHPYTGNSPLHYSRTSFFSIVVIVNLLKHITFLSRSYIMGALPCVSFFFVMTTLVSLVPGGLGVDDGLCRTPIMGMNSWTVSNGTHNKLRIYNIPSFIFSHSLTFPSRTGIWCRCD